MPEDLPLILLLLTWVVVIPYLILFPPQLMAMRNRLEDRRDRQRIAACRLNDRWRAAKEGTVPAAAGAPSPNKGRKKSSSFAQAGNAPSAVATRSGPPVSPAAASGPPALSTPLPRWQLPSTSTVVFAVVNCKSGGQLGRAVLKSLQRYLHPGQLFDVSQVPVASILGSIAGGPYKVLVCGGDGTVAFTMEAATNCGTRPPLAILPLGTGNDMSRSLGWGTGFGVGEVSDEVVRQTLVKVQRSSVVQPVDRWGLEMVPDDSSLPTVRKSFIMYFSFGIDAEISAKFEQERQEYPERFSSQTKNVVKYAMLGFEKAFEGRPLDGAVSFSVDGRECTLMDGWKGCIVSNVPYYHGGKNFWGAPTGDDDFGPSKIDDRRVELMAVAGTFHIGLCNIHVDSALRVGQGATLVARVHREVAMQIDGEPILQPPSTITCRCRDQYPMLRAPQ